jgi:DNA-nicking Smr family endonuclease
MELKEVIFIDSFPKIDLHGLDRQTARVIVNDFIKDNIKLRNDIIVIVHGIGEGILRKEIHNELRKNKNVIEFKTFYYNPGSTVVKINTCNFKKI